MYSYALHLRKGTYRTLPLSRSAAAATSFVPTSADLSDVYESALGFVDEDEEIEEFYRVSHGPPTTKSTQHYHRRSSSRTHKTNASISSFTDFVSAPGRPRKTNGHGRHHSRQKSHARSGSQVAAITGEIYDDVLFDEEESTAYASTSSRSRFGTEGGSSTAASDEERAAHADRNKIND